MKVGARHSRPEIDATIFFLVDLSSARELHHDRSRLRFRLGVAPVDFRLPKGDRIRAGGALQLIDVADRFDVAHPGFVALTVILGNRQIYPIAFAPCLLQMHKHVLTCGVNTPSIPQYSAVTHEESHKTLTKIEAKVGF